MKTVIGLEIHVELKTKSKMFCSCGTAFSLPPCTQCCPVCMGLPGALPTVNGAAVRLGAIAGFSLHSTVQAFSRFDRKQYFYPDLPKGYQITQRYFPLCTGGYLTLPQSGKRVEILEMHLEEDAGKLVHTAEYTFADLNRCGVPLLEIVTAPVLESGMEAYTFLNLLRDTLVLAGVTTGKMQEGALRVDVNVSLCAPEGKPGQRTEMKNLSSFKAVRAAIDHEAARQLALLTAGEPIQRETRRWDEKKGFSVPLRSKEAEQDYRYFPEPDLPPLILSSETLSAWRQETNLDALPEAVLLRLLSLPGMSEHGAAALAGSPALLAVFDVAYAAAPDAKRILNWLLGDYRALAKRMKLDPDRPPFEPEAFAALMRAAMDEGLPYQDIRQRLERLCVRRAGQ